MFNRIAPDFFYGNPSQYDWRFIAKQELLVPYNCEIVPCHIPPDLSQGKFPHPGTIRWERHRVWVVEGSLQPGESNMLTRRRFYIDEDSWLILLGEAYDSTGAMCEKLYALQLHECGCRHAGMLLFNLRQ